jgi:hypothetical protein
MKKNYLSKITYFVLFTLFVTFHLSSQTLYTDEDDLKNAVNAASATGGTFIVKNGTYNDFSVSFEVLATSASPIIIKAESIGGVTLTGGSNFVLKKSSYVTIEGFVFDAEDAGTLVKFEGSNNIRVTRNVFEQTSEDSAKWILIGGYWDDKTEPYQFLSHNNRIDHNIFQNKDHLGHYITVDGTNGLVQSQYDRIDHNYFRNNGPRATNEQESIRVGWSEMSESSGYTTVEYNLFEDCDGDPEIVSVKSCDNTIRHNTFMSSYGTLSLRHGNRNRIEGNYFYGNGKAIGTSDTGSTLYTGGIRIYGTDHVIINNYMEGLNGTKWDAPITLTQGDAIDGESSALSKHFRAERVTIAYNTLVNNDHGIEIGFDNNDKYGKDLKDITIANNLITGSVNSLVEIVDSANDQGDIITWANNLFYPTGTATMLSGASSTSFDNSEAISENPNLTFDTTNKLWRSTVTTPLYAYGASETVLEDFDGQVRPTTSNPGADHFSMESVRYLPMTTLTVGPNAYEVDDNSENLYLSSMSGFTAAGGTGTFTITSNLDWTISEAYDWVSVSSTTGSDTETITVTVTANETFDDRSATITVAGGALTRSLSFTQEAADPKSNFTLINDGTSNDKVTVASVFAEEVTATKNNIAANSLDKDFGTQWSGEGVGGEIVYDLGGAFDLTLIDFASTSGKTYEFQVWVSTTGTVTGDFTNAFADQGNSAGNLVSNTTGEFKSFILTNTALGVKYVKVIGYGQPARPSAWNTITEIEFYKTGSTTSDPDSDGDGVADKDDLCANTPANTTVDSDGCEIAFTLPSNNFTIVATGETCLDKNNGSIEISAVEDYSYKAVLNGQDYTIQGKNSTLSDLNPGTYDLCIEVVGEDYKQCFSVEVEEAVTVAAKSSDVLKHTTIEMLSGTAPFKVAVNGESVLTTTETEFTIPVQHGDKIVVESEASCEGVYSKQIDLYGQIHVFPNPVKEKVQIRVPNSEEAMFVEVYNAYSQAVIAKNINIVDQTITLDMSAISAGVYYIKLHFEELVLLKIIKE